MQLKVTTYSIHQYENETKVFTQACVYHTNCKLVKYGIRYSPSLSVNKVEEEAHYSKYNPNQ